MKIIHGRNLKATSHTDSGKSDEDGRFLANVLENLCFCKSFDVVRNFKVAVSR